MKHYLSNKKKGHARPRTKKILLKRSCIVYWFKRSHQTRPVSNCVSYGWSGTIGMERECTSWLIEISCCRNRSWNPYQNSTEIKRRSWKIYEREFNRRKIETPQRRIWNLLKLLELWLRILRIRTKRFLWFHSNSLSISSSNSFRDLFFLTSR